MKYACCKCGSPCTGSSIVVEGGIGYLFCNSCSDIVNSLPTHSIRDFVGPKGEGRVARNIREAKEARERGESPWVTSKPALH